MFHIPAISASQDVFFKAVKMWNRHVYRCLKEYFGIFGQLTNMPLFQASLSTLSLLIVICELSIIPLQHLDILFI